jgi:hypothetical protein
MMSYQIKAGENTVKAIRRIALKQIEQAADERSVQRVA